VPLTPTRETPIEELIEACPAAVGFLVSRGVPCVVCGEPFWGTIAELACGRGFSDEQIEDLVQELTRLGG
jgi:hypothetical protein